MLLLLLFGATGTVMGALLGFCDGMKGDGRSAARKSLIEINLNNSIGLYLTSRLLLLRWWMTLKERVIEENIERHSLFRVTAQQAEQQILEFWRCPNGNPKRGQGR